MLEERGSMTKMLFHPGNVLATADALRAMEFNEVTPQSLLGRHTCGDWGELPARERRKNELRALMSSGPIVSRFRLSDGEIVLVSTDLNESGTLISQPGDDKFIARFAEAWRHPCYALDPPGYPHYLVRIWAWEAAAIPANA
jgi:hypothetical protein